MSKSRDALIIHLFALLHAGLALGCRALGLTDEIVLTLLTMLLVVIVCLRRGMSAKFMAFSLILVNIIGFGMAKAISSLLGLLFSEPLVVNPISTFITTEIVGWGTYMIAGKLAREGKFQVTDSSGVRWLLLAFVIVIAVRLTILLILSGGIDRENIVASIIVDYVFSLGALIFLAENAMRINARALEDREKARLAQYRYMNLSQQVNPHFLFNSLNILDCLVCEQKTDQASTYIHKLAAIYRYLLRNEEERLVKLRDEMDFVDQYVDLLKVRFPEGLDIQIDIPADRLNRRVVPCSVQLLIENATKHNAVSADKPLQIMVRCEDDCVVVSNTLNPKISSGPSTGLGLKYLREQYQDVAGKTPVVRMGENEYTVVIPLI
ncbi:MAG: histidine kinase [Bacteroidales bacterium]|nr:histidine kinase [Bacteroidales bacterium]